MLFPLLIRIYQLISNNIIKNIQNGDNVQIEESDGSIKISANLKYTAGTGINIINNIISSRLLQNVDDSIGLINKDYTMKGLKFSSDFLVSNTHDSFEISIKPNKKRLQSLIMELQL